MNHIDISIADDHPMVINGIISLLQNFKHLHISAAYPNGAALLEGLKQHQPQVLLLDVLLPDLSGKELVPVIRELYPTIQILVLTSLDAPALVGTMLRKGCKGYLLKGAGSALLKEAIEAVFRNEEFIDPVLKDQLFPHVPQYGEDSRPLLIPELTQREKEVLELIAAEYTSRQISEQLYISYRTVENHRYNLLQKLSVKNTAGLVKAAMQLGLC